MFNKLIITSWILLSQKNAKLLLLEPHGKQAFIIVFEKIFLWQTLIHSVFLGLQFTANGSTVWNILNKIY